MVKEAVRKYLFARPATDWFDWLPEILIGLRMTTTRSHGLTPYFIMHKQDPIHVSDAAWAVRNVNWEVAERDEASLAEDLC